MASIIDKLNARNPLRNVRGAFNEAELAEGATRSALEKVNEQIRIRKLRLKQDKLAGIKSNG